MANFDRGSAPGNARALTGTFLVVLLCLTACTGAGSALHGPGQAAAERAIRSFERATRQADAEGLLRIVTPNYFNEAFEAFGETRQRLLESPEEFLGQRVHRRIESMKIAGGVALAQVRMTAGSKSAALGQVRLVKDGARWKVDHIGPSSAAVSAATRRVNVEMQDFKFKFNIKEFKAGTPLAVQVRNSGKQPHMMALWRISIAGTPIKLIESTDRAPGQELLHSPQFRPSEQGELTIPGGIPAGRYLMVCLLGDVTTPVMTPHYDLGMLADFEVPGK